MPNELQKRDIPRISAFRLKNEDSMRENRTLDRLRDATPSNLAHAARDIGHELPKKDIRKLSEFRQSVANLPAPYDDYQRGYQQALMDLVAAYEDAVKPTVTSRRAPDGTIVVDVQDSPEEIIDFLLSLSENSGVKSLRAQFMFNLTQKES